MVPQKGSLTTNMNNTETRRHQPRKIQLDLSFLALILLFRFTANLKKRHFGGIPKNRRTQYAQTPRSHCFAETTGAMCVSEVWLLLRCPASLMDWCAGQNLFSLICICTVYRLRAHRFGVERTHHDVVRIKMQIWTWFSFWLAFQAPKRYPCHQQAHPAHILTGERFH